MKEPSSHPPAPTFLTKLWVLVEDSSNDDVIGWNLNGQSFWILDEQRFAKEILPKYFKHNNMSSFIRQLNTYGFRKVISLESGLVRTVRGSAIEFQHPCFKKGEAELLENIKRKVTVVKTDDSNLSGEDLQKVLAEVQELRAEQDNMDTKLDNMRRENQALWKETASLRRRHSQQQKLLAKMFQFILRTMRGNVIGTKRKRALPIEASGPPAPKYRVPRVHGPAEEGLVVNLSPLHHGSSADDVIYIQEVASAGEGSSGLPHPTVAPTYMTAHEYRQNLTGPESHTSSHWLWIRPLLLVLLRRRSWTRVPVFSEDHDSVINSILNENCTAGSSDVPEREEIQDYLSCIDVSLEELLGLLSRKKVGASSDLIGDLFNPDLLSSDNNGTGSQAGLTHELSEQESEGPPREDMRNKDTELMQPPGDPPPSLFHELPAAACGPATSDPANLLEMFIDDMYPASLTTEAAAPSDGAAGETGRKGRESRGSHLPSCVLSPGNKLIDEATDADIA
ncbi:heat shock factor protein 3-like [Ascaphus truei]|uniref:heat shock factor protein 3-like n=1 Tax=Ascaphus truei TaxID=8439 RepID=UPI003F59B82D